MENNNQNKTICVNSWRAITEEIFGEDGAGRFINVAPDFDEEGRIKPESVSQIIWHAEKNAKDSDTWPERYKIKFTRLANKLKLYPHLTPSN